ncbi:NADPH:quinone oxidoreductase family protein [Salinimonas chungwhensis]|uniref:NADPH:quinone oxidoreductase family protein n=1 Tax=Salinimonas chungwhensis TaxID=265425 RepID=UPI0004763A08|nr:NADPH:quinone oxidoreductase family protein [Salinimonas chungwhensis]
MQAVVCHEFGPLTDLKIEETAIPSIKDNEVLIDVEAAGVNFPDALIVQGLYQLQPDTPFTPGCEVAGVVVKTGSKVSHLTPGQRVVGVCQIGGYAEQVAINAAQVLPLPDFINVEEAAALITAHATAHHALKQRANLQSGETLVVTGAAGGTGLAAVQIGKAMGARVIAVCSSEEKLALARQHGADEGINYTQEDLKESVKKLTNGNGADVCYECVGGDSFDAMSRAMGWGGRLLVVGFASGKIPKLPVNLTLVKGYAVVGVFWGVFTQKSPQVFAQNMQELMQWYQQEKVKVVIDKQFSLTDAAQALQYMTDRKVMGKVILKP